MSGRREKNSQIIYGRNPVVDAIEEKKSFERIYLKDTLTGEFEKYIRKSCKDHGIPLKKVPQIKLDKLTGRANHQGIAGIGSIVNYIELSMIIPHVYEQGHDPLFLLLDNVQDVRNIGSIARSAEILGVQGIIISGKQAGMITHDSLKASAGALTRLLICREQNTIQAINEIQSHGIEVVGSSLDQGTELSKHKFVMPLCIVMGSEGQGLHQSVEKTCDHLIKIPQKGQTESLNVSVATGIILYEINRQLDKG